MIEDIKIKLEDKIAKLIQKKNIYKKENQNYKLLVSQMNTKSDSHIFNVKNASI